MKNVPCFLDVVTPKRLITGVCALALMAALGSCITNPVVFDEAIPPEETASLFFVYLQPTSYNGIAVDKKKWIWTNIPQGDAVFVVDIESGYTSGKDFVFSFNFEGGKEYCLIYTQSDDEYGVNIYDSGRPVLTFPPENKLITFVPFTNQPDTITTTTTYR
jgi:hypothetical protein